MKPGEQTKTIASRGKGMAMDRFWLFHEGDGHTLASATTGGREFKHLRNAHRNGSAQYTHATCREPNASYHHVDLAPIRRHARSTPPS
ncbi:MAG: hypothetical protein ABIR55_15765, partial [Burkholderiaceae bacterium]